MFSVALCIREFSEVHLFHRTLCFPHEMKPGLEKKVISSEFKQLRRGCGVRAWRLNTRLRSVKEYSNLIPRCSSAEGSWWAGGGSSARLSRSWWGPARLGACCSRSTPPKANNNKTENDNRRQKKNGNNGKQQRATALVLTTCTAAITRRTRAATYYFIENTNKATSTYLAALIKTAKATATISAFRYDFGYWKKQGQTGEWTTKSKNKYW